MRPLGHLRTRLETKAFPKYSKGILALEQGDAIILVQGYLNNEQSYQQSYHKQ